MSVNERGRIVRKHGIFKNVLFCRKAAYSVDIGWRVVWQYMGMNHRFEDIGKRLQIQHFK